MTRIRTDSPYMPVANVLAQAVIRSSVEVEPKAIVIGAEAAGCVERDIVITARYPVSITRAAASSPDVTVAHVSPPGSGTDHRLRVHVPDVGSRGLAADIQITLESDAADGEKEARAVRVPLHRLRRATERKSQP